jgi:hypothetical protein
MYLDISATADARCWAVRPLTHPLVRGGWAYPLIETVTVEAMECGPNSEQVEAYLQQVARLDADGWAALARVLAEPAELRERAQKAIDTARSRARKRGILSEVDAAAQRTQRATDATLDASSGLQGVLDRALMSASHDDAAQTVARHRAAMAALRTTATSGALLLVLRPLLSDDEFSEAWPMQIIDPRSLPYHVYLPPMGAVG